MSRRGWPSPPSFWCWLSDRRGCSAPDSASVSKGPHGFFHPALHRSVGFYNQHELLIAQIGINAILAISLFVTFYSGQLSLANAGFMAIGAYTTVIMSLYLPTPLPLNMLVGALLAAL